MAERKKLLLRLDPAVAMRPKPPPAGGAVFLEKFTRFWNLLSFAERMTLRNVLRQRLRTTAGIFAAAMGSMLSVDAILLYVEMQHMVDFQFELVQRSDLDLVFKDEKGRAALDEARHWIGVDRAEPLGQIARNLSRRALQAARQLERDRHTEVTQRTVGRHVDDDRRLIGRRQSERLLERLADS